MNLCHNLTNMKEKDHINWQYVILSSWKHWDPSSCAVLGEP